MTLFGVSDACFSAEVVTSGLYELVDLNSKGMFAWTAVIIDRPGYLGAIQNFRAAGAKLIGWDVMGSDLGEPEDLILRYRLSLFALTRLSRTPPVARIL